MLPHPDNPNLLTNNYRSRSYSTSRSWLPSIKLDYVFNEKHRINYLYSHFHSPATLSINQFEGLPGSGFPSDSMTVYHRLNDDYVIRPNLLNHLTIGFNQRQIFEAPDSVNTFPSDLANQIYLKGNPNPLISRRFDGLWRRRRDLGQHCLHGFAVPHHQRQGTDGLDQGPAQRQVRHGISGRHLSPARNNNTWGNVSFSAAGTGNSECRQHAATISPRSCWARRAAAVSAIRTTPPSTGPTMPGTRRTISKSTPN